MWLKDALLGILAGSPHFAFLAPKLIDIPEGLALRVDSGLSTNVLVSDDRQRTIFVTSLLDKEQKWTSDDCQSSKMCADVRDLNTGIFRQNIIDLFAITEEMAVPVHVNDAHTWLARSRAQVMPYDNLKLVSHSDQSMGFRSQMNMPATTLLYKQYLPTPSRTDQGQRIGKLQRAHRVPILTLSLG